MSRHDPYRFLSFTLDDGKAVEIDKAVSNFSKGFNGVIFGSKKDGAENFCYDDIEITTAPIKEAPKAEPAK